jgi:hypothetical protein
MSEQEKKTDTPGSGDQPQEDPELDDLIPDQATSPERREGADDDG